MVVTPAVVTCRRQSPALPKPRLAAALIVFLFMGCGDGTNSPAVASPASGEFIVLLGDSHTRRIGWADTIIDALFPTRVEKHALGGLRSEDWLPGGGLWVASNFDNDPPTSVVILLGTNDAFGFVPSATYIVQIEVIVDRFIILGAEQIILVSPPSGPPQFTESYRDELYDLCDFDLHDEIECGPDLLIELVHPVDFIFDNIHLSVAGNDRVAELLLPMMLIRRTPEPY